MIRVVNEDVSFGDKEILAECQTLEEAERIQNKYYYFMTNLEKFKCGKWVKIDGVHDKLSMELSKMFPLK